jgi:hypothetical protein
MTSLNDLSILFSEIMGILLYLFVIYFDVLKVTVNELESEFRKKSSAP